MIKKVVSLLYIYLVPAFVFAQTFTTPGNPVITTPSGGSTILNPLGVYSICAFLKSLIAAGVTLGLPIAIIFLILSGLRFVTARGDTTKLKEARTNFFYTIIGIGIFLGAWLITDVIINTVSQISASAGGSALFRSC